MLPFGCVPIARAAARNVSVSSQVSAESPLAWTLFSLLSFRARVESAIAQWGKNKKKQKNNKRQREPPRASKSMWLNAFMSN